jgi:hypothetical protein
VTSEEDDLAAFREIRAVITWVLNQLVTFHPPLEQLADFIPASTLLGFPRRAKLVHTGEVWRLGIFLITRDGILLRAGDNTRVVETAHIPHVSTYRTQRHVLMDAAFRGGFPAGSVVNFNASPLPLDASSLNASSLNASSLNASSLNASSTSASTPDAPSRALFARGPHAYVRWRARASDAEAMRFADYMTERLELLLNPPKGATD